MFTLVVTNSDDWLVAAQQLDTEAKHIKEVLGRPALSADERRIHSEYQLQRNVIFRNINGNSTKQVWLVPKPLRWQVVRRSHDKLGHIGTEKNNQTNPGKILVPGNEALRAEVRGLVW